ncbi:MAG: response regulator transcription factor [Myxococcota bacterium]|nr:response regulator transcription factor [Myxococcota bacterium]
MSEKVKARVLFVEDEAPVLKSLLRFFQQQGFEAYGARSSDEALEVAQNKKPDIAVLDVMLHEGPSGDGEVDGFEICRLLREKGFDRPVIFLSARSSEEDKLIGFDVGADDYVTKPFSLPVLLARVRANLRRVGVSRRTFVYEGVEIDLEMHEIRHGEDKEQLSRRERDLLAYFIKNKNQILSRDQLLKEVWGYKKGVTTRTVDTHVLTIRKKLRDNAQSPLFIQTLHGVGYKFIGNEK